MNDRVRLLTSAFGSHAAVRIDRSRVGYQCKLLSLLVGGSFLLVNLGAPARAQNVPAQPQGPEPSDVEKLKEQIKSLEQTVEELKKERAAAKGEPPPPAVTPPLAPGTSTEVPEHERERGVLRQDNYAAPRVDNAPFDPQLRGFSLSREQARCCGSEDSRGQT